MLGQLYKSDSPPLKWDILQLGTGQYLLGRGPCAKGHGADTFFIALKHGLDIFFAVFSHGADTFPLPCSQGNDTH